MGGDSEYFLVMNGLHRGSTLSPFLFAPVMDELTRYVQGEMSWYMLFVDDIMLVDETRIVVNSRLEVGDQHWSLKDLG